MARAATWLASEPWISSRWVRAFLAGKIHWTNNGISIYAAARRDPTKTDIADDMDHAYLPLGPVGKPTELHEPFPLFAMSHTKYPEACKALMAFMQEASQFNAWLEAAAGFLSPALATYDANPSGPQTRSVHPTATLPSAR